MKSFLLNWNLKKLGQVSMAFVMMLALGVLVFFGLMGWGGKALERAQPNPQSRLALHRWELAPAKLADPLLAQASLNIKKRDEAGAAGKTKTTAPFPGFEDAAKKLESQKTALLLIDSELDSEASRWARAHPGQTKDLGLAGSLALAGDGSYGSSGGAIGVVEDRFVDASSERLVVDMPLAKATQKNGDLHGLMRVFSWLMVLLSGGLAAGVLGPLFRVAGRKAGASFGDMLDRGLKLARAGNRRAWAIWALAQARHAASLLAVGLLVGCGLGRPIGDLIAGQSDWMEGARPEWLAGATPPSPLGADWALGPAGQGSNAQATGAPWKKSHGAWAPATLFEEKTMGLRMDPWIRAIANTATSPAFTAQTAQLQGQSRAFQAMFSFYAGLVAIVAWSLWLQKKKAALIAKGKAATVVGTPAWEEIQFGVARARIEQRELMAVLEKDKARRKKEEPGSAQTNPSANGSSARGADEPAEFGASALIDPQPAKRTPRRL